MGRRILQKPTLETTITRQVAWRIVIAGSLLLATMYAILLPFQRDWILQDAVKQGEILAQAVAEIFVTLDRPEEVGNASAVLLKVARTPAVRYVNVLDAHGEVMYSSDTRQVGAMQKLQGGAAEDDNYLRVTHIVSAKNASIGAVMVSMDIDSLYAEYDRFYLEIAAGFVLAIVVLALLLAWMTQRLVGRRLWRLARAMENAENGSYLVRARVDKLDEVGWVALGFNKLLAALTRMQVKEIEREQDFQDVQEQLSMKGQIERIADQLKQSNESLRRRVKAQELLMDAAHHLGGIGDKGELVARLVTLVRDKLGWPDFAVFLTEEDDKGPQLRLAIASGLPNIDLIRKLTFRFGEGITGLVAQSAAPMLVGNLAADQRAKVWEQLPNEHVAPDFLTKGSMLSVPMLYQEQVVGVMDFFYPGLDAFDDEDVELLYALGALVALAIKNADLYEETLRLATHDPLTGVMNRRAMERLIESELARSARFATPMSLLLIDVDHFKKFNDRMGHVLGDEALQKIAEALQNSVRKVDGVARFGGEEFCVILPQTNERAAKEVADKLCTVVREIVVTGADEQPLGFVSISVGGASFPAHVKAYSPNEAMTALLQAADTALYAAKAQGRNSALIYTSDMRGPRG